MSRRINETTIPFLKDKGYGKGTNYTTDLVASLMLQYADVLVKTLTVPVVDVDINDKAVMINALTNTLKVNKEVLGEYYALRDDAREKLHAIIKTVGV